MSTGIHTKFTNLVGVNTPVVSAAMAGASGGALAAQVTLGGGFGFLAAGYDSAEKFRHEFEEARNALKMDKTAVLPIGVGFLGWLLDKSEDLSKELINIAFENRIQAIWLSFGNRLGHWVDYIRNLNEDGNGHRVLIFIQVCSVQEAEIAFNEWKADVIIAQGTEAGGHGAIYGLPLLTLLPSILAVVPPDGPPVLAAGGLVGGAHMASLLTLGAAGVVLGTRFLLSPESLYTAGQRKALLRASSCQSVRTVAFDVARNTLGWPQGIDGRALRNATVDDFDRGEDISILRSRYAEAVQSDDTDRTVVWAGTGVGLMSQITPAKDIVIDMHRECLSYLKNVSNLVVDKPSL